MNKKSKIFRFAIFSLCSVALFLVQSSCSTSKNSTHTATSYSKNRTRHQPRWNATTSQTTTYYIKKHSTRKRHNP